MKKLFFLPLILIIIFSLTSCNEDDEMNQYGTVKYIDLEGGFYGILGDDGRHYDPVNLADEFKKDGIKVQFKFKVAKNQTSFHMWGIIIEITSIEKTE